LEFFICCRFSNDIVIGDKYLSGQVESVAEDRSSIEVHS